MKTRRWRYLVDQVRRHFLLLHRLVRLDQHAILVWRHLLFAEDGARGVRKRLDIDAALHGQTEPAANPLPEGGAGQKRRVVDRLLRLHALVQRSRLPAPSHAEVHQTGTSRLGGEDAAALFADASHHHAAADGHPDPGESRQRGLIDGETLVVQKALTVRLRGCEEMRGQGEERLRSDGRARGLQRRRRRSARPARSRTRCPSTDCREEEGSECGERSRRAFSGGRDGSPLSSPRSSSTRGHRTETNVLGRRRRDSGQERCPPRTVRGGRDEGFRDYDRKRHWRQRGLLACGEKQSSHHCRSMRTIGGRRARKRKSKETDSQYLCDEAESARYRF